MGSTASEGRRGRRPHGDGSIYRAADGRWRGFVDLGWEGGKRRRKYVAARTQAEALARLRAVRQAAEAGVVVNDRLTVGAFLERWVAVSLPGTVSTVTADDYGHTVRLHLVPALGKKRLARLTVAEVDAFLAAKRAAGYKPNSVRIMRAVLRRALGQAEREGLVTRNVAAISQPPRLDQPEGRALTVDQARSLLAQAAGERLEAAFLLLLSYGLRRGELLGLSWRDLDEQALTLAVTRSVKLRTGKRGPDGRFADGSTERVVVSDVKTRRSRRSLYLTEPVLEALHAHRARQAGERAAAGALWVESGFIFTSTVGTPMDPSNFAKAFVQLCQRAGLGHWHPHEARHSAASVMLAQGVPLEVVSEILGHSSIAMTKDVYGHLVEGSKRKAAAVMSDALTAPVR